MRALLPQFLALVSSADAQPGSRLGPGPRDMKLVDLGCGTGRNTLALASLTRRGSRIVGLDAAKGMLDVARAAVPETETETGAGTLGADERVSLELYDLLQSPPQPPECSRGADGVVSTLVLEHIPLGWFFEGASAVLRTGGLLLVSNMHSEMGSVTQAGFVDPQTGTKVRPTSYCHRVQDVLEAAEGAGFEVVELGGERVRERAVDGGLAERLERARKYIGVTVWFGVCFRKMS
jgi:cyclopropane fatty-acyl-phospholipid synthase-like methyltransferase